MTLSRKWILLLMAVALICIAPPRNVHAYIDPGTGNYLLQILLAAMFGALFALKIFWSKIKGSLNAVRRRVTNANPGSEGKDSVSNADESLTPRS
jgi:hypothetical protein